MYSGEMGGRTWVVVAAVAAVGCGDGAGESRGDAVTAPLTTGSSTEDVSSSTMGVGASSESSSGDVVPPTTGDGTTSSSSSGESSSESGEASTDAAACGDGVVAVDEVCDDGNVEDGDGCNADCQPSGRVLWSDRWAGGTKLTDEALDCAVDEFGSIYVAGYTTLSKTDEDVWARTYSPGGDILWTQTYGGLAKTKDRGEAIVVDAAQLVYVAGHENVVDQGNNVWVRKHAADGMPTWTETYDSATSGNDAAYAATLTPEGDLLVVGAHTFAGQGIDAWLRKLSPEGATLWTRTYSGAAGLSDFGRAVAIDGSGYIFVAGEEDVAEEGSNMWTARFDPDGNLLWSRLYSGAAGLDDVLYGAAATDDGGVVVCGVEKATDLSIAFVRRYDADGLAMWTVTDEGVDATGANCYEVDVAGNGDVLIAGSEVTMGATRPRFQRMNADGALRWSVTIESAGAGASHGRCVREASDGTLVVSGAIDEGLDGRDAWVARLSP